MWNSISIPELSPLPRAYAGLLTRKQAGQLTYLIPSSGQFRENCVAQVRNNSFIRVSLVLVPDVTNH